MIGKQQKWINYVVQQTGGEIPSKLIQQFNHVETLDDKLLTFKATLEQKLNKLITDINQANQDVETEQGKERQLKEDNKTLQKNR